MDYIQAIFLAIVEGITEFLPISSTGHLVLASNLLFIPQNEFLKSFEIIIQLGAILAVVYLYRDMLTHNLETWKKIIIAFIPTGIIGLLLYKFIKSFLLGNEAVTLTALFLGGIILILIELLFKDKKGEADINKLTYKNAFLIGVFQSLSIVPGVSRAAATIIGARLLGMKRENAVVFSFLLAIPTMAAATGYDLLKSNLEFTPHEFRLLGVGFVGSFLVAILAVKFFIKFIQKHSFIPFGIYRILLALVYWLIVI